MPQFAITNGLRRAVLAKTRQEFRRMNVMLGLMDNSVEGRFQREGQGRLTLQRRGTTSETVQTGVKRSVQTGNTARQSTSWGTKKHADASEINVEMRDGIASRYDIPRLDQKQSPRDEVEDFRRRISTEIREEFEDDVVEYFQSTLTASTPQTSLVGNVPTATATHNGNAGSISQVNIGARGNTAAKTDVFSPDTLELTKATTASTIPDDFMLRVIDDMVLWAKRANLIDGQALYGDIPATLYLVMHPELFQFALLPQVGSKTQYRLDSLTEDIIRRTAVFGDVPFSGRLGLQNITIFAPNSLKKPGTGDGEEWVFWAGYTAGAVGGIADDFSRIWEPSQNPDGDGYDLYQKIHPFYNILNGDAFRRYTIPAAKTA